MIANVKTIDWLDQAALSPVVSQVLGEPIAEVGTWQVQTFTGAGEGLGVFRVSGDASGAGKQRRWSVILKVLGPTEVAHSEISSWSYWRREYELFESGILQEIPGGICAPRLYRLEERPNSQVCLWLEDLSHETLEGPPWPRETYRRAAYHLGIMNGMYLTSLPLPSVPCCSRNWLRGWVEENAAVMEPLREIVDSSIARQLIPPPVVDTLFQLWDARESCYALLNQLPQTFCHMDAFSQNLFLRRLPDGDDQIVALDWAFAGYGAVGEELVALVNASHQFTGVAGAGLRDLYQTTLDGYMVGLREAGWQGSPQLIDTVFNIASPLRFMVGICRFQYAAITSLEAREFLAANLGRTWDDAVEMVSNSNLVLADLAKTALKQLG